MPPSQTFLERFTQPVKDWFKPTTDMFDPQVYRDMARDYRNTDMQPYTLEENQQERKYGAIRKPPITNKGLLMRGLEGAAGLGDVADFGIGGMAAGTAKKIGSELLKRNKKWLGYPPQVKDARTLKKFRGELEGLALQGADKRFWYSDSGQAFLDAAGGDIERAKRLANFNAITSSGTDVKSNFGAGSKMYYQDLMGDEFNAGRYPQAMGDTARHYAAEGEGYLGPKRNPFFNDIMSDIDPNMPQDTVTNDMWGARLFGYGTDSPGAPQHRVMTDETRMLAERLGWKPNQTQAAYWSSIKGRWESVAAEVQAKGKRNKWGEEKLRSEMRKAALKADIPEEAIHQAGYSFKDAMDDTLGGVGWEAIPSFKSGLLPEIHNAPYKVKQDFTQRVEDALGDTIEQELGILTSKHSDAYGVGFYEEGGKRSFNPSKQIGVIMPPDKGGVASGKIDPSAKKAMELYAAIRGKMTFQDSVGYGRSFTSPSMKTANQYDLSIGREFTPDETEMLMDALEEHPKLKNKVWFAPSKDGIIINHDEYGPDVDHKEFIKAVREVTENDLFMPDVQATGHISRSDGGLIGGDYGESYDSVIKRNGGEAKELAISDRVSKKVKEVYRKFAKEQGYKDPFPEEPAGINPKIIGDRLKGGSQ
jgi:hypothetical protein